MKRILAAVMATAVILVPGVAQAKPADPVLADNSTKCTVYYWKNINSTGGPGTGKRKVTVINDWYVFRLTDGRKLDNPTYRVKVEYSINSNVTYSGSTRTLVRNPHTLRSFAGYAKGKGYKGQALDIKCASWTHVGKTPPG